MKKIAIITITVALVVGSLFLFNFLTRNDSLATADKTDIENRLKTINKKVNLPGILVKEGVQDLGCDSSSSVGTADHDYCSYESYKLYKHNGDVQQDIRQIEQIFAQEDIKALTNSHTDAKLGKVALTTGYLSKTSKDATLGGILSSAEISALADNEYIYGFRTTTGYYSCTNASIFKQPCPAPNQ